MNPLDKREASLMVRAAARVGLYAIRGVMAYRHALAGVGSVRGVFSEPTPDIYTHMTRVEGELLSIISKTSKELGEEEAENTHG